MCFIPRSHVSSEIAVIRALGLDREWLISQRKADEGVWPQPLALEVGFLCGRLSPGPPTSRNQA